MPLLVELTAAELAFLKKYGLDASNVYDGRGQSQGERETAAKQGGFDVILGARCTNARCPSPENPAHITAPNARRAGLPARLRHNAPGYVYIAGSLQTRLLKIGIAADIEQRARTLQYETGYGAAPDWKLLFHAKVAKKGRG